jgi:hypothetical protein
MKLIIDELTIKDATVLVRPGDQPARRGAGDHGEGAHGQLKNIGNAEGAQNGAAMRDVVQQVITVLAANASQSNLLPEELRGLLNLDVNAVMAELGTRLGAEAQKRIAAAVPGSWARSSRSSPPTPTRLLSDPGKAVDAVRGNVQEKRRQGAERTRHPRTGRGHKGPRQRRQRAARAVRW